MFVLQKTCGGLRTSCLLYLDGFRGVLTTRKVLNWKQQHKVKIKRLCASVQTLQSVLYDLAFVPPQQAGGCLCGTSRRRDMAESGAWTFFTRWHQNHLVLVLHPAPGKVSWHTNSRDEQSSASSAKLVATFSSKRSVERRKAEPQLTGGVSKCPWVLSLSEISPRPALGLCQTNKFTVNGGRIV